VNELTEINDQLANAIGEQIEQPLSERRTAGQIEFPVEGERTDAVPLRHLHRKLLVNPH
jgi:hypothetical protein